MVDPIAAKILIVEDEPAQMELLRFNLEQEGYATLCSDTGEDTLLLVEEEAPDLILLDWMLPDVSGIELCRQLKARKASRSIPVIMLTARGQEDDRIRGLDTGADDYVVKPYSVKELMARVRARIRSVRPGVVDGQIGHGEISVNTSEHRVTSQGRDVSLGPIEYKLLLTLLDKPGRVWSRDQLLDRVWGREADVDTRTVDVHVGRLRKALGTTKGFDPIRTVRGFGYSLNT